MSHSLPPTTQDQKRGNEITMVVLLSSNKPHCHFVWHSSLNLRLFGMSRVCQVLWRIASRWEDLDCFRTKPSSRNMRPVTKRRSGKSWVNGTQSVVYTDFRPTYLTTLPQSPSEWGSTSSLGRENTTSVPTLAQNCLFQTINSFLPQSVTRRRSFFPHLCKIADTFLEVALVALKLHKHCEHLHSL